MVCRTKKRTRIIMIVVGLILIIAGIIVGRLLIRKIASTVTTQNCLPTGKDSSTYKNWAAESVRKTAVTFWNIKNKDDFLYRGQAPKFDEKGPYIYTSTTKKVDIKFEKGKVSFKQYKKHVFDAKATAEKCPSCTENDKITVLNLGYIGVMTQSKGDSPFSLFMISNIVKGYLQQLLPKLPSKQAMYTYLGDHTRSLANPVEPAFGPWLAKNANFAAAIVNGTRGGMAYKWTEMEALYNVLSNSSLLLPPQGSPTTSPLAKGRGLLTYLSAYLKIAGMMSATSNATIKAAYAMQLSAVDANIKDLLCPSPSSCFQSNDTTTKTALLMFITSHLAAGSMAFMDSNNYGLLATHPVKELVFGYVMTKLPLPPKYPSGVPVPGALTNHSSEGDAISRAKVKTLHTCDSTTGTPNTWAGYDGKTKIPQEYFPQAKANDLTISGYDLQFTATTKLSPCTAKYPQTAPHFDMFLAPVYQRLRLTYDQPQETHGIRLNRYLLNKDKLKANNATIFMDGILDITKIQGVPMSVSLPGFLHGDPTLYKQLSLQEPTPQKYGTNMDIEPVTGKPMVVNYRIQINSVVTKALVSASRIKPLNISYHESSPPYTKHFPIYWTEEGGSLTKADANALHDKLFSYFTISCSVTMILPIIGGILLLVGVVLFIVAAKKSSNISNIDDDGNATS